MSSAVRLHMAKVKQLARLFLAISSRDWARARGVAEQIIEAEETAGHHAAANALRGSLVNTGPVLEAIDPDSRGKSTSVVPTMLTAIAGPRKLETVELSHGTRTFLKSLLNEQRHSELLKKHGLEARRKILFYGPPGCGKTITARALATELGLPLYVVRFDALMGAFLGQTATRIREVFQFAELTPSVVFIDEIDAIGRRRGRISDVAELDRVVITVMQQLDFVKPAGLVIAASNMPTELDSALVRRFDAEVSFRAPSKVELKDFAKREASLRGVKMVGRVSQPLSSAKTYADVERIILAEQRLRLLNEV